MSKIEWENETTYSKSDPDRTPRVWALYFGAFRLSVHRIHQCDGWFVSCDPFFNQREVESKNVEEVKIQAMGAVSKLLREARDDVLRAIGGVVEQGEKRK